MARPLPPLRPMKYFYEINRAGLACRILIFDYGDNDQNVITVVQTACKEEVEAAEKKDAAAAFWKN